MPKNYYQVLDIPYDATEEEITKQYHFMMQAYHPDKFQDARLKAIAEEKTKLINKAFYVLSNSQRRTIYHLTFAASMYSNSTAGQQKSERYSPDDGYPPLIILNRKLRILARINPVVQSIRTDQSKQKLNLNGCF